MTIWIIHGTPTTKSQWFYGTVIDERHNRVANHACFRAYKVEIIKNNECLMPYGPGFKKMDLQEQVFPEEEFKSWDENRRVQANKGLI